MSERIQGEVSWFNSAKGWGFIQAEKEEYFIHFGDIITNDGKYKKLDKGDKVSFEPKSSPKGIVAKNVTLDA